MKTLAYRWKLLVVVLAIALVGTGCRRDASTNEPPPAASASSTAPLPARSLAAPGSSKAAPHRAPAQGLWWKVTSGPATIYLLGSIHVARADLYPLDPRIEQAFSASDVLVVEVDLTKVNQFNVALKMQKLGTYPAGDSLDRHVSAEILRKLEKHAPGGLYSASTLKHFRPWLVAMTILQTKLAKLGYDPEHGLDNHFMDQAKESKDIVGLETIDEQIEMFTGMPEATQVLMLEQTLDDLDEIEPTMKLVLDAWRRGDPKAVDEELIAPMRTPELQPVFEQMFSARNRRWDQALAKYAKSDRTYFVVVGAGHLVGKDSVVDLLQRRGEKVVPQWKGSQ